MGVKFVGKLLPIAVFCICAAVSLVPAESRAAMEDAVDAAGPVAIAFAHEDFAGEGWEIDEPGEYDLGKGFDLPNDSVCSIRVMPGCKVTIYEHSKFGGKSVSFTADSGNLGEWNSRASSLIVARLDEKARPKAVEDWLKSVNEAETKYAEPDADMVLSGLAKHEKSLRWYKSAGEFDWYGGTSDAERVKMAGELLEIFRDCGVKVDAWTPNTLAQRMNDYYDLDKRSSIWRTAAAALNVDPDLFD